MNKRGRIAGTWHGDFVRASNLDRSGSTCPSPASELPSVCVDFASAPMRRADRTRRRPSPVRASTAGHTREKARRLVRMRLPAPRAPTATRGEWPGSGGCIHRWRVAGAVSYVFILFSYRYPARIATGGCECASSPAAAYSSEAKSGPSLKAGYRSKGPATVTVTSQPTVDRANATEREPTSLKNARGYPSIPSTIYVFYYIMSAWLGRSNSLMSSASGGTG